ncbi:uncharacterized protein ARB_05403 [Trichophyton benhamiae CBS 112371]|uniref:Uncharacterized protein n=1 Tax=Arthroderma benhamiae (strain ATCC MYA-4681 / CBS 112371) TaxID=663331 RepID=D4AMF0_ARTBC|nr:uncharacterized protein ARB_05403 [Trichophyton benhamiae CBS 112371]EFE35361.1 hypothetical protein ARB_05403 [Trichophyton benhamiae CBS 112371]
MKEEGKKEEEEMRKKELEQMDSERGKKRKQKKRGRHASTVCSMGGRKLQSQLNPYINSLHNIIGFETRDRSREKQVRE